MSDSLPMSGPLPAQDESPTTIELDEVVAVEAPVATQVVGDGRRFERPQLALREGLRSAFAGFNAIGVKELRGRMRGRRAFVILTVYLLLLATFAWMMELILEQRYGSGLAGSAAFASAQIGGKIF